MYKYIIDMHIQTYIDAYADRQIDKLTHTVINWPIITRILTRMGAIQTQPTLECRYGTDTCMFLNEEPLRYSRCSAAKLAIKMGGYG